MNRALILLIFLLALSLICLSCGNSAASGGTHTSGLKYRAFLSNSVSAGSLSAAVFIVDAQNDLRANASPIAAGNTPGMMVVTPNKTLTLVFSGSGTQNSDNQLTVISNAGESAAGHVSLPGMTESFVASPDSSSAYVALPTATVNGSNPGILEAISLGTGTVTGQVDIPSLHYLSRDNGGNRIFGFSDNSDSVSVITPSQINIGNAVTPICCFDRPVWAYFTSDDNTAYVLNCGAECGGTQASIQKVDLTLTQCLPSGVCPAVPLCTTDANNNNQCAGSVAMVNGSTMYVAGTPYSAGAPSQTCTGQTTAATACGLLTIVDLGTMTITNTSQIVITDGYHNRIALGPNGQLFVGAHTCTEIIPPVPPPTGAETRGCLSIYNTLTTAVGANPPGGVVIPPVNGDVTGLQPISSRSGKMPQQVVYVVQGQGVPMGGTLFIYDTTTDALELNPNNPNTPGQIYGMVGDFVDVKIVD